MQLKKTVAIAHIHDFMVIKAVHSMPLNILYESCFWCNFMTLQNIMVFYEIIERCPAKRETVAWISFDIKIEEIQPLLLSISVIAQ